MAYIYQALKCNVSKFQRVSDRIWMCQISRISLRRGKKDLSSLRRKLGRGTTSSKETNCFWLWHISHSWDFEVERSNFEPSTLFYQVWNCFIGRKLIALKKWISTLFLALPKRYMVSRRDFLRSQRKEVRTGDKKWGDFTHCAHARETLVTVPRF